jgi:hypothetical protein
MHRNLPLSATLSFHESVRPKLESTTPADVERRGQIYFDTHLKLSDLVPAVVLLIIGSIALVVATLAPSGKDGQYAIVAPPWYRLGETVALIQDADGRIVDMRGPANLIIAHSDDPNFVQRLYGAGAWLVVDPLRLRGCVGLVQEAR